MRIIPRENWKGATKFKLNIPKGFLGKEGNLAMKADLQSNFVTIDDFKVKQSYKPDDVFRSFNINFTSEISVEEFAKNVEISPKPESEVWEKYLENLQKDEAERTYFTLPPLGNYWKPNQEYDVKLKAGLKDKYGRELERDFSEKFSAKFPTKFESVFFPEQNAVFKPDTDFKPTFWYSGEIVKVNVEVKETLLKKHKYTKSFDVESSLDKEVFWELDLKEHFPEIFGKDGKLLVGKYEMKIEGLDKSSLIKDVMGRRDYYPRNYNTNFYVSDFAVGIKQFPSKKFELNIASFQSEDELSEEFNYEIYEQKQYNQDYFKDPVLVSEIVKNGADLLLPQRWGVEVVVKAGDKVGFGSTTFNKGMNVYESGVEMNAGFYERDQKRSVNFADRPLYKPGQTVYLKSIFRELQTDGKVFPLKDVDFDKTKSYKIEIRDPRWGEVATIDIDGTTASMDAEWIIPEDAMHGNYNISVSDNNGQIGSLQVYVGEYRKSNFLLDGKFGADQAFYKETEKMMVNANFAFGGALSNRPVNYRVFVEGQNDCFWRWDDFGGGCGIQEKELANGEGILDGNGEFQKPLDLDFEIEKNDPVWDNLKFRATVRDGDAEENSVEKSIPFYMSTEKIELDQIPYYAKKDDEIKISGKVSYWQGEKIADKDLTLKILKPKSGFDRSNLDGKGKDAEVIENWSIRSDEDGKFNFVLDLYTLKDVVGSYEIEVTSKDSKGRVAKASHNFWIPGVDNKRVNLEDENKILPLILDKDSYEVGERVEVFIPHSEWKIVNARATLERGEILEDLIINLENQTVSFDTEKWMAPNVYVSVLLEGKDENNNPKIKWGVIDVPVQDKSRNLEIEVTANKENYKPGEKVSFEIKTMAGGENVPAELTVVVVDETLLSLKSRNKMDLIGTFLAKLPLGVGLSHTVANFVSQDQIDQVAKEIKDIQLWENDGDFAGGEMVMESIRTDSFSAPEGRMLMKSEANFAMDEEAEMAVGGGMAPEPVARDNFQDTAKFIGKIMTDKNGVAKFDFELPDNLTTWNVYVIGHTEQNNFGSAETSVKTSLPLLISELVPNFFQMGDEVQIGLLIRRNVPEMEKEDVEVKLELPEGFTTDESVKTVEMKDETRVFFTVKIAEKGYDLKEDWHDVQFGFTVKGEDSGMSDKIVLERKLFPPKISLTAAEFLRVEGAEKLNLKPDLKRAITSNVLVKVFVSLAAKLETFVDVAARQDYGCAEQRFSHSTAILVQKEFDEKLGRDSAPIDLENLMENRDYLQEAFVNGGGFAFWKHENEANFWVTAQILEFADLWKNYGAGIDEQKISSSQEWLKNKLLIECKKNPSFDTVCVSDATRQNAGYTLAKAGMISSKDLKELSKFTHSLEAKIWWLKSARVLQTTGEGIMESDQKLVTDFWTEIDSTLKARDRYIFWEESKDYWSFYSQNERLTALIFEEILAQDKLSNHKHKIARYLAESKVEKLSGNTALRVLQVMGIYAENHESGNVGSEYVVMDNEGMFGDGELPTLNSEEEFVKDVTGDDKFSTLTFETQNDQPFYADVVLQETFPANLITPISRGFWIDREIYAVDDEKMENPLTNLEIGKNYVVRLKVVTNTAHRQVMLEDRIPSGAEFVNFDFENVNRDLEQYAQGDDGIMPYSKGGCYGWCRPTVDHKEFHAEKARFFMNYLGQGTHEVKYVIKTRLAGEFDVLPARVEEMYYPEVFATTEGAKVTIGK